MVLPFIEGGRYLINLETRTQAAQLQGIRRIIQEPRLPSAAYLRMILNTDDIKETLRTKPVGISRILREHPYYNSLFKLRFKVHNLPGTALGE